MQATPVRTGDDALDHALGGGLRPGATILSEGPDGACSTEFAFTLLRAVAAAGRPATFATALRAPVRAETEFSLLFPGAVPKMPTFRAISPRTASEDCAKVAAEMEEGGVLVLESASALARVLPATEMVQLIEAIGESIASARAVLVLLHAAGSVSPEMEASLGELADGVFSFSLREGAQSHRRALTIRKMRGLAPVLDGEMVPVFEARMSRGVGLSVTSVRSVV